MRAEGIAILELEFLLSALLRRHRQDRPGFLGGPGNAAPKFLIHQDPHGAARGAPIHGCEEAFVDDLLAVGQAGEIGRRRTALDAVEPRLVRPAMVERHDKEMPAVEFATRLSLKGTSGSSLAFRRAESEPTSAGCRAESDIRNHRPILGLRLLS